MTPERLLNVQKAYVAVAGLEPSRRAAVLADICAGDDDLREQVERLLDLREEAEGFLETPPPELRFAGSPDSFVGKRVGPWRLVSEIGRGGMGVVYQAARADDAFQKQVAVKMVWMAPGSAELVNRFRREREILAALDHPNIARLLDGGATEEGLHYLVLEFVAGMPITDYCNERRLSINDRLRLFRQVCEAVQYAHRNLVIHRDLKPGNIFVTADGSVKLLDFGIAKLLNLDDQSSASQQTLHLMTLDYASPEQVRGEAITTSGDIYSLGVTLYKLLTGHRPYQVKTSSLHEMARVICEEEPEAPSAHVAKPQNFAEGGVEKLRRRLKGDLDNIVLMALRKEAARRYSSAEQLSEDIGRFLEDRPVIARKSTLRYRAVKYAHRHPLRMAFTSFLAIALVATTITVFIRARAAEGEARRERRRLYEAQMRQAGYDFEEGNFTRLRATLESYIPKPSDAEDLRGFEWYLLARSLHQERLELKSDDIIYSLAYSPDGKKVAAACGNGLAKIWETTTGKELLKIKTNGATLGAIAFSPDGHSLATCGGDRVIRLWNADDGQEKTTWKREIGGITSLAFSPDGKKLLCGAHSALMLIDIATGNTLTTSSRDRETIFAVAFLDNGRRFVSGGEGGKLNWWDAGNGRWLFSINPHSGFYIFSLAVSSDGRRLASSGGDKTARVWDTATGEQIATFRGHTNAVRGVAFSPDDRSLVTASADRTIRLWDVKTEEEIEIFRGHTDRIRAVAFSPDGLSVASGSDDQTVKIWDVTTEGKPPEILRGHPKRIFSIAFAPDGRRLATAGGQIPHAVPPDGRETAPENNGNIAKVWNLTTGRVINDLLGHTSEIRSVAFSADGRQLATGSEDLSVRTWDATTGQALKVFAGARGRPGVIFLPSGKALAILREKETLRFIDVATREELVSLRGHDPRYVLWVITSDGKRIITGTADGVTKLWDFQTGRELARWKSRPGGVLFSRLSGDDRKLFAGFSDGAVIVRDLATKREQTIFDQSKPLILCEMSPDGGKLVKAWEGTTASIWDATTGRETATLIGHTGLVRAAAFSPDGETVATAGEDRTIKLWNAASGDELATLNGHTERIYDLEFSSNGQFLASAGGDGAVKLWDVKTRQEIRSLNGHPIAGTMRFSPDGAKLLISGLDGAVILWDVATGRQLAAIRQFMVAGSATSVAFSRSGLLAAGYGIGVIALREAATGHLINTFKGHSGEIWSLRFSPDGKLLASASWDMTAKLWDVASGRELHTFKDQNKAITAVAFSPDNKLLATGSDAHTVKLWEVATGRELFTMAGHADQVLSVAFSPDGRRLASGSTDHTIRIWDVETGQELLALRGHKDEVWSVAFSPDGKLLASGSWDKTVRLWYANGR
ncbi:MAG TPA: protein kinase [Blastocatellia bacterium]|nr:protein kinase [Blastocatellia bacterium]